MTYENPQVPHEVNVSRESVVAEFLRLLAGLVAVLVVITALLYFGGGWLARLIPFSIERSWVGEAVLGVAIEDSGSAENLRVEAYLKTLVDGLASKMDLPPAMQLTVHYTEMDVPNAFATLGGHIIVTSELYQRMPSENALAMVLAHEVAHVRARDPVAAVGGTASIAVLFALLSGEGGRLMQHVGNVVMRGYSRQAEARADEAAIEALKAFYGHAGGAAAVFEMFLRESQKSGLSMPSFLSTHPADEDRILRLKAAAGDWNDIRQPLRPIVVLSGSQPTGAEGTSGMQSRGPGRCPQTTATRKPRAPIVGNGALNLPLPMTFSPCTPPEAQRGRSAPGNSSDTLIYPNPSGPGGDHPYLGTTTPARPA